MKAQVPSIATLQSALSALPLESIARSCGFKSRERGGITPLTWCAAFCLAATVEGASLRIAAFFSGLKAGLTLSKQAIHSRLARSGEAMIESALEHALALRASLSRPPQGLPSFRRVIVQDSCCLSLPQRLAEAFPGAANQSGPKATMRIQAYIDLAADSFLRLSMGCFRDNDQGASGQAAEVAGPGDLLVRDLGYFSLKSFKSLIAQGIDLLTRYQMKTDLVDPSCGQRIELLKLLRTRGSVDMQVLVGKKSKLPMRLVAYPAPDSVANQRRRKLRADRDRRRSPDKQTMALQGWQIFLTSAEAGRLPASAIGELYAMRWRIEVLFKSWKSHLSLASPHCRTSEPMIRALVFSILFKAVLMHATVLPARQGEQELADVSALKLASLFEPAMLVLELQGLSEDLLEANISKHSRYDRRKRLNYAQQWRLVASSIGLKDV